MIASQIICFCCFVIFLPLLLKPRAFILYMLMLDSLHKSLQLPLVVVVVVVVVIASVDGFCCSDKSAGGAKQETLK